jgi:nucleotide-binding universal stress UspA family protein
MMPSPIIVGVALRDDDRAPLALAEALAGLTGAPLALVTSYPYGGSPLFVTPEWINGMREQAEHTLARVAAGLSRKVEVRTYVRSEMSPALALHDVATELDGAAIVVGSCHRGAVGRVLAGSVGAGLLHGAPCPVAIAPRGYEPPAGGFRRIGAGFVDSLEGRSALAAATGLARAADGRVTVFAVEEPIAWSPALVSPGWSVPRAHQAERDARARVVAEKAGRLVPTDVLASVESPVGVAGEILAERSAELDLLVCGSRGYGALRSVALGSVSRMLAHSARCPLLIVPRPPAEDATKLWRGGVRQVVATHPGA